MLNLEQSLLSNSSSIPLFEIITSKTTKDSIEQKGIYLLTSDLSFLEEKWSLIAAYTQKIDPNSKIGECKITEIKDLAYIKKGFTYYVDLYEALPRLVRELYGTHDINTHHGNCHGAATVAAGIFPTMSSINSEHALKLIENKTKKISIKDLTAGDLVYLHKLGMEHSFIFLDKDISLSMNGKGQALEIHLTDDILKLYGFSKDIFSLSKIELQHLTIFQKNQDWTYPELIMPSLTKIYQITDNFIDSQFKSDPKYNDLKSAAIEFNKQFKNLALSQINEKDLEQTWIRVNRHVQCILPKSILQILA